jgi:two-component system CheB/CheR fusion protein
MSSDLEDKGFEGLLGYIKQNRGFDFTGYKPSSLKRRIEKRMQMVNQEDFAEYKDFLEVHPEEFSLLFNTILINVTAFFRDPSSWEYLSKEILPRVLSARQAEDPIRIWSAGCASGEEAYTLAMVLVEAMGDEQFRQRVKIYATDVDEEALSTARHATYTVKDLEAVPEDLRTKYFSEIAGERRVFRGDLRRCVIFGRHDLMQDAPISRLDLLVCRNTLMYFNSDAQGKILARFHFALRDDGILFLGKAEMLLSHAALFTPVNLMYRIFAVSQRAGIRERLLVLAQTGDEETGANLIRYSRQRDLAFDTSPIIQLVVDDAGRLTMANEQARSAFGLRMNDINRPLKDLEVSYRPVDLRGIIDQAKDSGQSVEISDIQRLLPEGKIQYFDLQAMPLLDNGNYMGVAITFQDVTNYFQIKDDLSRSRQDLETANEELQSSNEEMETTNEELQSTVEELETTNEELQSTNEEMETMNEELQSTNEELQTMNDELRIRTSEFIRTNKFLEEIMGSLQVGVIVLDQKLTIQIWNRHAQDLWGLREEEVRDELFFNLDIGLPLHQLAKPIKDCMTSSTTIDVVLDARNRRGKPIRCSVRCTPLREDQPPENLGVVLLMEDVTGQEMTETALRGSDDSFRAAILHSPISVFIQGKDLRYNWISSAFAGMNPEEIAGHQDNEIFSIQDAAHLTEIKRLVMESGSALRREVLLTHDEKTYCYDLTVGLLLDAEGKQIGIMGAALAREDQDT